MRIYRDDTKARIEFGVYFNNFKFDDRYDAVIRAYQTYTNLLYIHIDGTTHGKYVFSSHSGSDQTFVVFMLGKNVENFWS